MLTKDNDESLIRELLVVDLKELLGFFNKSKSGLKRDLIKRSIELLQLEGQKVREKITEIHQLVLL